MIISFTGPSGIGKGYVKDHVRLAVPSLVDMVWLTTRELRPGETNRLYVPLDEFNSMERDGELVLVQDLYSHRYAMLREDLEPSENVRITEFHCMNMEKARQLSAERIIGIAFVTESIDFLRQRMRVRHTETEEEIDARLKDAIDEIAVIKRNAHLFTAVFEVTHTNEAEIAAEVLRLINTYLRDMRAA